MSEPLDQYYFEQGYLEDDYFVYVAEAKIDLGQYIEEGYLDPLYFENTGGGFALSATLEQVVGVTVEASGAWSSSATINVTGNLIRDTGSTQSSEFTQSISVSRIRDAQITVEALFTPSIVIRAIRLGDIDLFADFAFAFDISRFRDTDSTLENIINLSLQSDRIRDLNSALSASFEENITAARTRQAQSSLAVSFDTSANADVIKGIVANLDANAALTAIGANTVETSASVEFVATLAADVQKITFIEANATLGGNSNLEASAIKYQTRPNPYNRPIDLDTPPYEFSTTAYSGDYSLISKLGPQFERTELTDALAFDTNEDFRIQFAIRLSSSGPVASVDKPVVLSYGDFILSADMDNFGSSQSWAIGFDTNFSPYRPIFKYFDGNNVQTITATSGTFNVAGWNYIILRRTSGTIRLSINGSTHINSSNHTNAFPIPTTNRLNLRHGFSANTGVLLYDDMRIFRGTDSIDSTKEVLNYQFENNANDAWYITHEGAASLTSTVTLAAEGSLTADAITLQVSAATLVADAEIIAQASANISSEFTQSTLPTYPVYGDASIASEFAQTAVVNVIRDGASTQSAQTDLTALVGVIKPLSADFEAFYTQLTAVGKIGEFFINADSQFVQTATANRIASLESNINSAFTQVATPTLNGDASADFASEFAQSTDANRIRDVRIGYAGDRTPKVVSTYGNVEISTAQSKFGSGSALITDTGDYFTVPGDSSLYNGNFTVEMWLYASNLTSIPNGTIWDNRTSSSSGMYLYVSYGSIGLGEGINIKGLTSAGFNNNQWNHIALVRNGTNAKVFVNGVQKISATVTTTNYSNRTSYIGSTYTGSTPMRSYFDEVRLSSSARYTTGFTPSTSTFTSDGDVRALLHLDTNFSDDVGYAPGLEAFVSTLTAAVTVSEFLITLDSAFSLIADGQVIAENETVFYSSTSLTANVEAIRNIDANLSSAFTQTTDAIKGVQGIGTLIAQSAINVDYLRIRSSDVNFDAVASQLTAAAKIGDFLIDASVAFTLEAQATGTISGSANLQINADVSATVARIRDVAADIDSFAALSAEGFTGLSGSANLTASTQLSNTISRTRDVSIAVDALFEPSITVNASRNGEIVAQTISTLAAEATRIQPGSAEMSAQSQLTATISKIVNVSSNMNASLTVNADGKLVVFLEQLTYVIPREFRTHAIERESRNHRIAKENRTYIVRG